MEMYLAGVSVRRVEDIAEALWGTRVSPSTVSNLNKKVYAKIEAWRNRPIEGAHPYVFLDGIVMKRTWAGEVRNVSLLVAIGVNAEGCREIPGICEGAKEGKSGWSAFLRRLVDRGLRGVELIVSDACRGLVESLAEHLPDARWQRRIVHFYRNVFPPPLRPGRSMPASSPGRSGRLRRASVRGPASPRGSGPRSSCRCRGSKARPDRGRTPAASSGCRRPRRGPEVRKPSARSPGARRDPSRSPPCWRSETVREGEALPSRPEVERRTRRSLRQRGPPRPLREGSRSSPANFPADQSLRAASASNCPLRPVRSSRPSAWPPASDAPSPGGCRRRARSIACSSAAFGEKARSRCAGRLPIRRDPFRATASGAPASRRDRHRSPAATSQGAARTRTYTPDRCHQTGPGPTHS